MHLNLVHDAKIMRVANAAAAATDPIDTAVVDTQGYDSIAFVAFLGDVTADSVITLTVKTNSASHTSVPTPVTTEAKAGPFTAGASDMDHKAVVVDVMKPRDRYVFATLTRTAQNAVVDGIFAICYNAAERPLAAQDASIFAAEFFNDPDPAT